MFLTAKHIFTFKENCAMKKLFAVPTILAAGLLVAACASVSPAAPAAAPAVEATAEATEAPSAEVAATEAPAEEAPAEQAAPVADIVDTAVGAGSFGTLVAAVQAAGLVDTLKGEGPFTVFAPTEEAFAALPPGTLEQLLADPQGQLTQILLYHVVPGKVMAADVTDGLEASTAQGSPVKFMVADGKVMINDANVVATDIAATNGVIHVIDKVILPPAEAGSEAAAAEAAPAAGTIPEVAAGAGNFATLLAAVEAAGLADELSGEGLFTVFAPTDEAFAKIPADTLNALLADPQGQLTQILLYHVVPGRVLAADVKDGLEAETLQGAPLRFTVGADGSVKIGDVTTVGTDVVASNGVIHVIDAVLLPPAE
jgi:transforming growth factor-beta-induced protein